MSGQRMQQLRFRPKASGCGPQNSRMTYSVFEAPKQACLNGRLTSILTTIQT